jgi:hypothetical protein
MIEVQLLPEQAIAGWQWWVIPAVSILGATVVTLAVGRLFFSRRETLAPSPSPEKPPEPAPDPFIIGSAFEKRGTIRRQGNPVEVALAEAEPKGELMRGWVVDRSMGGLCLHLYQPVTPGTILTIRACNAPPATLWIQIEIRSCRQDGKFWEVGCKYLGSPSWGQLLQFN